MKRIFLALAVALCLAALVFPASAATTQLEKEQIIARAESVYAACQISAGRTSFHGYCGLMTSHQLYHMGINDWCKVGDGNEQFDMYANMEITSGGYYVTPYYLEDYTMEEALNALCKNGARDVYNILVGFQQTNTESGQIYGHSVFITAILDGVVYFMEGYDSLTCGKEGTVARLTVREFVNYYASWTVYEGIIHFGAYDETCAKFASDVYLQVRFDTGLRSEPGLVGTDGTVQVRSVKAGELLHTDTLVREPSGDWYYKVENGYIPSAAVAVVESCGDAMALEGFSFPEEIDVDEDPQLTGKVVGGDITAVTVSVIDTSGAYVLRERVESNDLSELNELLWFDLLAPGQYWVEVTAEASSAVVKGHNPERSYIRKRVHYSRLHVGMGADAPLPTMEQTVQEGWFRRDGVWYCYSLGRALTGWQKLRGVQYYLDTDGSTLTGWQKMQDGVRYFTPTGAMVTGWLVTDDGTYYLDDEGVMATGTVTVDGKEYVFDDQGLLQ